ncbi:hypothetical protein BKA67DRAFT_664303 [Truncatella angustata]|uniref:F-box domain-containing protein n=1 Tax=Truncatella angustata TaxID=152316 RepID=A0A9P8RNL1_9PEZI|nr:uncharacterized protein BKA67DRAFT_664303 [Truncatella angustata]KAH6646466.1 hypothetical protein BKA67DRAFT_664303 [Truncatella angustata]KAH8197168.1 hypothetical protein TruAng_008661 [Truncatella angustata]
MAADEHPEIKLKYARSHDGRAIHGEAQIINLPNDIFLLVISYLSPEDNIICRRVNRAWQQTFSSEDVALYLLRLHFPRALEMRMTAPFSKRPDWVAIFGNVARRYHHLRAAKPHLTEKIKVAREDKGGQRYHGITPWNRFLHFNEYIATFAHRDPVWCMDNGLLIYLDTDGCYIAYDLESEARLKVPFETSGKTVRRIRLACRVLIIEWCEREPYHQLNDRETVHRHFATAFDVERCPPRSSSKSPKLSVVRSISELSDWTITLRSEWKIHFLGLPLNRQDRFFSAHTATHYALYLWQPNRSPWGEGDPLEQLTIWNISFPSQYRPSHDPTGMNKPDHGLGPQVIQRFTWRDLDFLGLRQRDTPSFREIMLDDQNVYIHEEEHRWLAGPQSSLNPPRHHLVRCTGIPMTGTGPIWFDECCADGDVHMSFCPRAGSIARLDGDDFMSTCTKHRPAFAPCWRHEEFPYLTISEMIDSAAGVRIVARQCFMVEALSVFVMPRISVKEQDEDGHENSEVRFTDDMWGELMGKGRICGDERFLVGEDMEGMVTIMRF